MKKLFLALLALPLMQGMASAQGNAQAGKAEVTINVEGMGAQHPAAGEDHSMHKM